MYERCLLGMDEDFEHFVAGVVALSPWMSEEDKRVVREVLAAHDAMAVGEEVDVGVLAAHLSVLGQRAEEVGDMRRAWMFDQWYLWACADV